MLRTLASKVGLSSNSMLILTAVAARICSHHSEGAGTATAAPASAPTASMIRTRSSDMISAMPRRKARLSQSAQEFSPSQSVKFTSIVVSKRSHLCASMVPVGLNSPSGPPAVGHGQTQLDFKRFGQVFGRQGLVQGTGGHDVSALEQHGVRDAGGNLLDVMRNQHRGRGVLVLCQLGEGVDQCLAAREVKAGRRLIEQQ